METPWFEFRTPTEEECDQTGASPEGAVLVHVGHVIAVQDEYGTVTLCVELAELGVDSAIGRVFTALTILSEVCDKAGVGR